MRTLTFEQLRINLTLTFDTLEEPVQIVKKGKIQGYIVRELPEKQECKDKVEPEIVPVSVSGKAKPGHKGAIIKTATDIDSNMLRIKYKLLHPLDICGKCQRFNRECICV